MNGTWTTTELAGHPVEVYAPASEPRPRLAVLYLHDRDGETLRNHPTFTRWFDELRLGCLCPIAGECWWADRPCPTFDPRLTPERYLLDHVVPFFAERWEISPRGIGVLGIGMGGQGALRLAFKHAKTFGVVAGIASAIDHQMLYHGGTPLDAMYDSAEQCRQDTATLHVHPSKYPEHIFLACDPDDDWHRGNDRLHEKLGALAITHEADLTTTASGHTWSYFDQMAERAVRFVHAGLLQQGRRLL